MNFERRFEAFLGIIPIPVVEPEKRKYSVRTSIFDFGDEKVKRSPLALLLKEELVLENEAWPEGKGTIVAFYEEQTGELRHLCVGRIVVDEATEDRIYLGLRYTPRESRLLRFDAWPPHYSLLKERIPRGHFITGNPVSVNGDFLLAFVKSFGIKNKLK